jgi:hypothetical protein
LRRDKGKHAAGVSHLEHVGVLNSKHDVLRLLDSHFGNPVSAVSDVATTKNSKGHVNAPIHLLEAELCYSLASLLLALALLATTTTSTTLLVIASIASSGRST